MLYRLLADLVVLTHLAFIIFAVLGGLLALRRRGWAWLHVPAALWAVLVELAGWPCPLTPLENLLRLRAGLEGYQPGFVEHYIVTLIYPVSFTRSLQIILGTGVLAVNALIYALVIRRRRLSSTPFPRAG